MQDEKGENEKRAYALGAAMFADASLRMRWRDWLENKIRQNAHTDSALSASIVRLAADGLWLSEIVSGPEVLREQRHALMAELITMTRRN